MVAHAENHVHPLYQHWCGSIVWVATLIVQENTVAATCALMADINRTDGVIKMWRYAKWPTWRAYWCHSMLSASTRICFGSYDVHFSIKRCGSGGTSEQIIYITINHLCLCPSSRLQRSVGMATRLSGLHVYLSISTTGIMVTSVQIVYWFTNHLRIERCWFQSWEETQVPLELHQEGHLA